jgi:hypothetical protein
MGGSVNESGNAEDPTLIGQPRQDEVWSGPLRDGEAPPRRNDGHSDEGAMAEDETSRSIAA